MSALTLTLEERNILLDVISIITNASKHVLESSDLSYYEKTVKSDSCNDGCYGSCDYSCGSRCETSCTDGCNSDGCTSTCGRGCYTSCEYTCSGTCDNTAK